MVRVEERDIGGWDLRSIYEVPITDLMEAEAFFAAFGRVHIINGHKVRCVLTNGRGSAARMLDSQTGAVVSEYDSVLFLRVREVSGVSVNDSLKIDGRIYRIVGVSRVLEDMLRVELMGHG